MSARARLVTFFLIPFFVLIAVPQPGAAPSPAVWAPAGSFAVGTRPATSPVAPVSVKPDLHTASVFDFVLSALSTLWKVLKLVFTFVTLLLCLVAAVVILVIDLVTWWNYRLIQSFWPYVVYWWDLFIQMANNL